MSGDISTEQMLDAAGALADGARFVMWPATIIADDERPVFTAMVKVLAAGEVLILVPSSAKFNRWQALEIHCAKGREFGRELIEDHVAASAGTPPVGRPIPEATAGRNELSDAAHAVLDLLDEKQEEWADLRTWEEQIAKAASLTTYLEADPIDAEPLAEVRKLAIEAAARLIDAIGEIDRCIAAGEC